MFRLGVRRKDHNTHKSNKISKSEILKLTKLPPRVYASSKWLWGKESLTGQSLVGVLQAAWRSQLSWFTLHAMGNFSSQLCFESALLLSMHSSPSTLPGSPVRLGWNQWFSVSSGSPVRSSWNPYLDLSWVSCLRWLHICFYCPRDINNTAMVIIKHNCSSC